MVRVGLILLKWSVSLGVLGALFWTAYQVHNKIEAVGDESSPATQPRASTKLSERSLKFSEASAQSHGLKWTPAEESTWQERVTVYGRVVPNPAATVTVQAPVAGTLRSA